MSEIHNKKKRKTFKCSETVITAIISIYEIDQSLF